MAPTGAGADVAHPGGCGAFSPPLLALRQGRYPEGDDEVALTDDLAKVLRLGIGEHLDLDGRARRVVGVVENPSDLTSDFALVSATDRALAEVVAILVGGDGSDDELRSIQAFGAEHLGQGPEITSRSPLREDVAIAAAVLGVTAIALLLVALVASAGFVVIAQRRLRQLGVLAALGATERLIRLVVLVNGAAVGAVASLLGGAAGIGAWLGFASRMEEAIGHRIERANVPWWAVVGAMGLVVVAATLAAWWPARLVARVPVVNAWCASPCPMAPGRCCCWPARWRPPSACCSSHPSRCARWRRWSPASRWRCAWQRATWPATRPALASRWPR